MFVTRSHMQERLNDSERFWKELHETALVMNGRILRQNSNLVDEMIKMALENQRLREKCGEVPK